MPRSARRCKQRQNQTALNRLCEEIDAMVIGRQDQRGFPDVGTEARADGFTHLLVNPGMLAMWDREGWNDPRLTPQRVLDAADEHAELIGEFPDGSRLYQVG